MQEYKNGATRNSIESSSAKEEAEKLKSHMGDLRDKLAQLELQVNIDLLSAITNNLWGKFVRSRIRLGYVILFIGKHVDIDIWIPV